MARDNEMSSRDASLYEQVRPLDLTPAPPSALLPRNMARRVDSGVDSDDDTAATVSIDIIEREPLEVAAAADDAAADFACGKSSPPRPWPVPHRPHAAGRTDNPAARFCATVFRRKTVGNMVVLCERKRRPVVVSPSHAVAWRAVAWRLDVASEPDPALPF